MYGEVKMDYAFEKCLINTKNYLKSNIKWCDPCLGSGELYYLFKIHISLKNISNFERKS